MRIVHLYKDYYPPVYGGIEQTVSRLARGAARAGHEVTVVCSAHGSRRDLEEVVEGVRVIRCAEWGRVASTPICPGMPARLARVEADVLHLQFPSPPGEVSFLLTHRRTPMVISYQGDVVRQAAVLPFYWPVIHAVLDRARVIMAASPPYIEHSAVLRRYREKCQVVPLGIDLAPFEHLDRFDAAAESLRARYGGGPLVLFVGRFRYYKGLRVLLRAMGQVRGTLVLVGGGGEERELIRLHRQLGLGDRVHFAGSPALDGLLAHYRAADVAVLPSISPAEAYGLVLIEAMASGVPAVSTELGTGTSYINRHEETGLVVPPGDPAALAAALNVLLDDPARRRAMGEAGRRRAHDMFSAERMLANMLEVYREALGCREGAARRG
jgi:glycosyltransferase involved in cell wall biosynthesis